MGYRTQPLLIFSLILLMLGIAEARSLRSFDEFDLAYVAADEGLWQIWVAHSENSLKKKLTQSATDLRSPAWSPDGTKLVYATGNGRLILQKDGENPVQLSVPTIQNSEPAWSPDGGAVAYISYIDPRAYQSELWTVLTDENNTSQRVNKVNIPEGLVSFPTWKKGAISYARLEKVDNTAVTENICNYDTQTGEEQVLIRNGYDNTHPSWSPDGTMLAYASNRGGNFDIWVWNSAADAHRQITTDPAMDHYPTWSADGRTIAFTSARTGSSQVWLVGLETGDIRQVGFGGMGSKDPAWRGHSNRK